MAKVQGERAKSVEVYAVVITEKGHHTVVRLPELIKDVKSTLTIENEAGYPTKNPVRTKVWIQVEEMETGV